MNNVFLELPIVKVDPANNWQSKDYAREHFEKGLFIADDGVLYHLVFYQEDWPTMMPIPKEQIEAMLKEDNRQPRTTPAQGKPKQIDPNNQVDAFYREKRRAEEEERARLIAELKAKHGITDGDANDKASG